MPPGAYLVAVACFAAAAISLYFLARFAWVRTTRATILAFALLYNGKDRWHARETIDAMGPTMAAFSRD